MKTLSAILTLVLCAAPVFAQSPNNSTIVVLVTDQSGAVVRDAKVSVANNQTGAVRDVASGSDGSATITALPLTGTYRVLVSKQGFGDEQLDDVTLRAGETATLKVRLTVGAEKTEVTVYGTPRASRRRRRSAGVSTPQRSTKRRSLAGRSPRCRSSTRHSVRARNRRPLCQRDVLHHWLRQPPHDHVHAGRREQRRGRGAARRC